MILDKMLETLPPMFKGIFQSLIPNTVLAELDTILTAIAQDLKAGRDQEACDKMRRLLVVLGVDLDRLG